MRSWFGAAALGTLFISGGALAEPQRDFCPDRPGKGSPPCVLEPGVVQVEVGAFDASFQRAGPGSSDTYAVASVELHLGLTPVMEGQVQWTPYTQVRARADGHTVRTEGVDDLMFLLRRSLRNPDGSGFSVALEPFVSAPTGKRGIGAGGWQGGLIVPMSVPLSEDLALSLAPEVDIARDADGEGTHLTWTMAAGLSWPVGLVTLGAELWGSIDDDPAGQAQSASLDLTLAWSPPGQQDLQFDAGVYGGLTRDTPDLEVSLGLTRRF